MEIFKKLKFSREASEDSKHLGSLHISQKAKFEDGDKEEILSYMKEANLPVFSNVSVSSYPNNFINTGGLIQDNDKDSFALMYCLSGLTTKSGDKIFKLVEGEMPSISLSKPTMFDSILLSETIGGSEIEVEEEEEIKAPTGEGANTPTGVKQTEDLEEEEEDDTDKGGSDEDNTDKKEVIEGKEEVIEEKVDDTDKDGSDEDNTDKKEVIEEKVDAKEEVIENKEEVNTPNIDDYTVPSLKKLLDDANVEYAKNSTKPDLFKLALEKELLAK